MKLGALLAIFTPVAIWMATDGNARPATITKKKVPPVPPTGNGGGIPSPPPTPIPVTLPTGGVMQQVLATDFDTAARPRSNAQTIAAREAIILKAVQNGQAEVCWGTINVWGGGMEGQIDVMCDALCIEGVRISASCRTQQLIADVLSCCLLTPKVSDAVYEQASRRIGIKNQAWYGKDPKTGIGGDNSMGDADRIVDYNAIIEAAAAQAYIIPGGDQILDSVGKDWVLCRGIWAASELAGGSPQLDSLVKNQGPKGHVLAANYGWQGVAQDPGMKRTNSSPWAFNPPSYLVQGRIMPNGHYTGSTAHTIDHSDYSQIVRLMKDTMRIRNAGSSDAWQTVTVASVLTDPSLAELLSWEGALPGARHPGVPPFAGAVV